MKRKFTYLFLTALFMLMSASTAMAKVTFTAIEGSNWEAGEGSAKVADGLLETKWCAGAGDGAYVILEASEATYIKGFTMTTANDNETYTGRAPKTYAIYGSNDMETWDLVYSQTDDNVIANVNFTPYTFYCNSKTAYKYFKLNVTAADGGSLFQLSEFELIPSTIGIQVEKGGEKAMDGQTGTKWESGSMPQPLVVKATEPFLLESYQFTTGNDDQNYHDRGPKDWVIEASNNLVDWDVIDEKIDCMDMPNANYTPVVFTLDAAPEKMYQYYRVIVNSTKGATWFQMSEVTFVPSDYKRDASGLFINEDGYFELNNADDVVKFAAVVAGGNQTANAILTADIDMTGIDFGMIGTESKSYKGTFDGQYHVISNLVINKPDTDNIGFFGTLEAGATVKNLVLDASCSITGKKQVGMIGHSKNAGNIYLSGLGNMGTITSEAPSGQEAGAAAILGNANSNSAAYIDRCWSTGKISGNQTCLISGWQGNSLGKITNCWSIAVAETPWSNKGLDLTFYRYSTAKPSIHENCWSIQGTQVGSLPADVDVAGGELCYLINSGSAAPVWYQRIGVDAYPVPYEVEGGIVYAEGSINCDGTFADDIIFSNTEGAGLTQKPHTPDADGTCSSCGMPAQDADGNYLITNGASLVWFAKHVNAGNTTANALMTKDVDLTGIDFPSIGNSSQKYSGTFDGQGYTISGYTKTTTSDYTGIFGYVKGATVKNITLKGDLTLAHGHSGFIGHAETSGTFTGLISYLNMNVTKKCAHIGGIVGSLNNACEVAYCEYRGTLTYIQDAVDSNGAMVGYANEGHIHHNIFAGTINYPVDVTGTKQISGILGYVNNANFQGFHDNVCIGNTNTAAFIGQVNTSTPTEKIYNNYWLEGSATFAYGGAKAPADQVATPEDIFINGEVAGKTDLYQTIGVDKYPSTDPSRGIVYLVDAVLCTGEPVQAYSNSDEPGQTVHVYENGVCIGCGEPHKFFFENLSILNTTWEEGEYGNITGTFEFSMKVTDFSDDAIVAIMTKEEYEAKGIYDGKILYGALAKRDDLTINSDGTLNVDFTCFEAGTATAFESEESSTAKKIIEVIEGDEYVVIFHKRALSFDGVLYKEEIVKGYGTDTPIAIYMDAYVASLNGNATGIDGVQAEGTQKIFNLNGVQVKKAQKGQIYIINGKKVMVK